MGFFRERKDISKNVNEKKKGVFHLLCFFRNHFSIVASDSGHVIRTPNKMFYNTYL